MIRFAIVHELCFVIYLSIISIFTEGVVNMSSTKRISCAMAALALSFPSFAGVLGNPHKVESVGDSAMGVFLQGDTLYCIADDSLYALDVSTPLSPKLRGSLSGMDNRRQVVAQGNFAYVVSRETGLRIVDVSNPEKMQLMSRFDSVEFATGIEVVGNTVFLSERINGVEAVDVSEHLRSDPQKSSNFAQ